MFLPYLASCIWFCSFHWTPTILLRCFIWTLLDVWLPSFFFFLGGGLLFLFLTVCVCFLFFILKVTTSVCIQFITSQVVTSCILGSVSCTSLTLTGTFLKKQCGLIPWGPPTLWFLVNNNRQWGSLSSLVPSKWDLETFSTGQPPHSLLLCAVTNHSSS